MPACSDQTMAKWLQMQVIEPLTEKTWGRGWVVLVVRTKWRGTFAEHSIRFTVYENWVLWYGLGSIITISVCNLFNSTRFILSIPDTLLTFCFTRVSWHPNQLWRKSFRRRMKEWPRIKTRIGGIKKKEKRIYSKEVLAWKDFARDLAELMTREKRKNY